MGRHVAPLGKNQSLLFIATCLTKKQKKEHNNFIVFDLTQRSTTIACGKHTSHYSIMKAFKSWGRDRMVGFTATYANNAYHH